MLQNLWQGLTNLHSAVPYLVFGSIGGVIFGIIPGLSGAVILSITLAFVYNLNVPSALCLFLATQAASFYSASVTSIILNTPAHPEAFAVTLDGYPMARRGQPGRALGISAMSTLVGGLVGCVILVGFIQLIGTFPNLFHPPEYVLLVVLTLLLVGTIGSDSVSKSVTSAGVGLLISCIGSDSITGAYRFTFGSTELFNGLSLVAVALGLFAISQMILVFGTGRAAADIDMLGQKVSESEAVEVSGGRALAKELFGGMRESLRHWVLLIQSSIIGVVTGIVPGIGGFAANFLSYGFAQQTSRKRRSFGTGIPEGIIAAEGSSLAKEAGGVIPVISLGIPGGVGGALLLTALSIKGIRVGYGFAANYPTIPYEMVWIIAFGGLIGTVTGAFITPWVSKLTRLPGLMLIPLIMPCAIVGAYVSEISYFAVLEMAAFAVVGLVLRRLRYSLAALVVGLVLGSTLEDNINLTTLTYPDMSFLKRPFTDVLLAACVILLVTKAVQLHRDRRRGGPAVSLLPSYPLLSILTTLGLIALGVFSVVYARSNYDSTSAAMPTIAGIAISLSGICRLPFEGRSCLAAVKARRRDGTAAGRAAEGDAVADEAAVDQRTLDDAAGAVGGQQLRLEPAGDGGTLGGAPTIEVDADAAPRWAKAGVLMAEADNAEVKRLWGLAGQYTREVYATLWFAALVAACYFFGFTVGIAAFCVLYGLLCTGKSLRKLYSRVAFAVISAAVMAVAAQTILDLLNIPFNGVVSWHW